MAITVYEVAGGFHAEDAELFMACYGITEDEACAALERSRERAAALEYRLALAPETDVGLDEADLADLLEAQGDIAAGRVLDVTQHC